MRLDVTWLGMLAVVACSFAVPPVQAAGPVAACATARNDDTVRPYDPALKAGFLYAYRRLFPHAGRGPTAEMLRDGSSYRCMDGRLLACFVGANLPCEKIDTARRNPAVDRFCADRDNRNTSFVPMYVTGHDTMWSYACHDGTATILKPNWDLDRRGFARSIWAPME